MKRRTKTTLRKNSGKANAGRGIGNNLLKTLKLVILLALTFTSVLRADDARFFRIAGPVAITITAFSADGYVSAFYMDRYEVTTALWDDVYSWAITHGYSFEYGALGKATNHPAHSMTVRFQLPPPAFECVLAAY